MGAFVTKSWRSFLAIFLVATYSLWSVGAFALSSHNAIQHEHGKPHARAALAQNVHIHAAHHVHDGGADAHHAHHAAGLDANGLYADGLDAAADDIAASDRADNAAHDDSHGTIAKCCGVNCVAAMAADLPLCTLPTGLASAIPSMLVVTLMADTAINHYRPPIHL